MSRMRARIIDDYASHYSRASTAATRPTELRAASIKGLERTLGPLLSEIPAQARVLDLGCGTGTLLHWISVTTELVPEGVDLSESQIEIAQAALPNVKTTCSDGVTYLQAHSEAFAGILCFDLLEHIPSLDDYSRWFEAIVAALEPGGFFCCRVPNAANLTGAYSRYIDLTHERSFTRPSIIQLLEAGGLTRVRNIPIRSGSLSGRIRQSVEAGVHRAIYRLCGRGLETVFTSNLCAVGYKP